MKAFEILEHFKKIEILHKDTKFKVDCFDEAISEIEELENQRRHLHDLLMEEEYYRDEAEEEIERLEEIVEEAIKKPMGVEPHSWSDYKMEKRK